MARQKVRHWIRRSRLNVERESGSLTISAEDTLVEIAALTGLRQVNATGNALAAYQFNARPFTLALKLKPIEPVISRGRPRQRAAGGNTADRRAQPCVERRESRHLHAGIDAAGRVRRGGRARRGRGRLEIQRRENAREFFHARCSVHAGWKCNWSRPSRLFPTQISVTPLRVTGAAKETAQIGAASAPGIRLQTGGACRPAGNSREPPAGAPG